MRLVDTSISFNHTGRARGNGRIFHRVFPDWQLKLIENESL